MKGLIISTLAGLIIASIGSSYADATRFTVINDSAQPTNLNISSGKGVSVGSVDIKMFTAEYKYPAPILFQTRGQFSKPCNWSVPPVGNQTISVVTLNLSIDQSTKRPMCLLSWQ